MDMNIIHDDRFFERFDLLKSELETQGITDYKIFPAIIDRKTVVESINASFKAIVLDAKERGLKEVMIAEDDLYFRNENGFKYFMDNKPDNFDVYIGGTYLIDNRIEYKAPIVKVDGWVGNQLIIINEKYYDTYLSVPNESHIDTVQQGLGDFYLCFPMPALQRPSKSANNNNELVNYNAILPKEFIYDESIHYIQR
jgi:hypothetical protein